MMEKNSNQYDMSEVGICSSGVVTKCEKGYKKIRKDPKSNHKNGTRIKGANILRQIKRNGTANSTS